MSLPLPSLRLLLVLALVASCALRLAQGQPAAIDPDVTEGIKLVESGDYDAAILTLDNAARRLAADPSRVRDLSQAYLYLGIAYVGKGHEAAARAKFREALARMGDLTLSPEQFPPKVIDVFEAAREEAARTPARAVVAPAAPKPQEKKGGSKTPLLLVGLGAAGVGVAVAAGGGGASATPSPPAPTPSPVKTEVFSGSIVEGLGNPRPNFPIAVARPGTLEALLNWGSEGGFRPAVLTMELFNAVGQAVARATPTGPNSAHLAIDVFPPEYALAVFFAEECGGCRANFEVRVIHP